MTKPEEEQSPINAAKVRQTATLVSTVWLIPLLAAIIGAWLLAQNIRTKGPEITLHLDTAEGIEVNTTAVRILNVDVGRITKIRLRPDQKGVELTARLNKDVEDFMREDTQFWIVKPRIDQNGITGLGTLVSGAYIAFSPGKSATEKHEFQVAELPPVTAIGQSGIRLHLSGKNSKMLGAGSPVLYENHTVGTVESAKFDPSTQTVNYSIFIHSPNESLITSASLFWLDSGVNIRTDGAGVSIQTPPLSALLSGAISFYTPKFIDNQSSVKNGDQFKIFNDRRELESQPSPRTLYYVAFFDNSVRGLEIGAPVEYKGIKIGTVADVPYFDGADGLNLLKDGKIPVRLRLEPYLLETNNRREHRQSREYWEDQIQAALNRGLTAAMVSNNLVLGSKMIELSDEPSDLPKLKPVSEYHGHTVIATRGGGSLENLQAQMGKLLEKFNALPLDKTVGELNSSLAELKTSLQAAQTMLASANQAMANVDKAVISGEKTLKSADKAMASVDKLLNNKNIQQMPVELNKTLMELRETLKGVSPQSPVYQDVQATLQSIDRTLKDVKPVVKTLKEQPNALIFNSSTQDPNPKGQ
ncbi:intermembrane transport protein PqiB [Alysiella crassa]|uniref:Paraquat-inducible protein B n=1 Tax=Alysiella crassa TaxID=153491 RepID=A0A376BVX1_9NEIS|nr:MlaD family protein [Alysiella crassa]UOP08267.1 MlaD family protein [Alysiella crassa]SSY80958.1 paraquat-inducible protein B [Alysiella crassa]